jgi:hypothetical protein
VQPGQFVTVFDIAQSGLKGWYFPAFGLIFIAIGYGLTRDKISPSGCVRPFMGYVFIVFATLWTALSVFFVISSYRHDSALASDNRCKTVEGTVENFHPMPYQGHAMERFTVSGVPFAYSDFVVTDAFNNTASHGGPIRAGQTVRICYDPESHAILRLAIRGYRAP